MNRRESCLRRIEESIRHLRVKVEMLNTINLYDVNIIAEDFYANFLNILNDSCNYINLNDVDKNAKAIDLFDKPNKSCYQITSDNSSTKIHDTLKKFEEAKLHKEYTSLKILMLVKKKDYTANFDKTIGKFSFSKSDIIDPMDLYDDIKKMDPDKIERIAEFLDKEVMYKLKDKTIVNSNEVETVVSVIEYLSDPTNFKGETIDKENVDPDHKINNRFAEHSDFLIETYTNLYPIYKSELEVADSEVSIDTVSVLKRQAYLKLRSNEILSNSANNPKEAFNKFALEIENAIKLVNTKYDYGAIKFFLINELIKCNVFPNPVTT